MILIDPSQVTTEILSLFDLTKPTMPRAFNVLEGVIHGQILVDDLQHPTWAAVRETTFGTLYTGGRIDASRIESLVRYFRQIGDVGIGCWPDDQLNNILPSNPDYDGRTLYFTERSRSVDIQRVQLPDGYVARTRSSQELKQSSEYESLLEAFGTEENILSQTLGVVILLEDKVVCEAATGAPTQGRIEIGVTTADAHRRRGLALISCSRLIEMCETHEYSAWWDCAKQNVASTRLAHKLGFQNEREYRFVWWQRNNV